jgi:hypothetical protein
LAIFSDIVVQVGHGLARVPDPVVQQAVWKRRVIPQVGIPETAECVVIGFVFAGVRVDVVECF